MREVQALLSGEPARLRVPAIVSFTGSDIFRQVAILLSVGQPTFTATWGQDLISTFQPCVNPSKWTDGAYLLSKCSWVIVNGPWTKGDSTLGDGSLDHPFIVGSESLLGWNKCVITLSRLIMCVMQNLQNHLKTLVTWKLTLAPPADSPNSVMLSGLPPNERIFLYTQAMAACWSHKP